MKILIVDDDAMILHLLKIYLGDQLGHETVVVRSGAEALSQLRREQFDIALIDLKLPDMVGFQILEQIRTMEMYPSLPVLVMTATKDVELEIKAFELGANDFMYKPLEPRVVVARVDNMLKIHDVMSVEPEPKALPQENLQAADLNNDFSASSSIGVPTGYGESATFYGSATIGSPMVPCEFPVLLLSEGASFFCKTVKIGSGSLMLLAFNEVPVSDSFQVQLAHPNGETVLVETSERERRNVEQDALGATRLLLEVVGGDELYFELCSELAHGYRFHGMNGIRDVLSGGNATIAIPIVKMEENPKENYRYRFLKLLGKGGFASVYLVRDLALKRDVAMKVLAPRLARKADAKERFLGEAQIAAQFHHPNIVFVYEVGEYGTQEIQQYLDFPKSMLNSYGDQFTFFTMHYVNGKTVGELLGPGKPLPEPLCMQVFMEVLSALSFAHNKGVVHQDIKPGNIMLDENDQVIVTDFGIASIDDNNFLKDNKQLECTPRYASPEQLLSRPVDGRSDLYSLAMTVYHMYRGQPAFGDRELTALIAKQLRSAPPALTRHLPNFSAEIEKVILRCLAKNPGNRYEDADQVLDVLTAITAPNEDEATSQRTLNQLLDKVLVLDKEGDVVSLMDKLVGFLHLHQGEIQQGLREKIAEPAILDAILARALREEHFENLYHFFKTLNSSRAVHTLLRWFEKELWPIMKAFLARLAVVSATEEPQLLVDYCRELSDNNAVLMLRAFAEEGFLTRQGLISRWVAYQGTQTRLELLRYFRREKNWSKEARQAVVLLANEGGPVVADAATKLFKNRH